MINAITDHVIGWTCRTKQKTIK